MDWLENLLAEFHEFDDSLFSLHRNESIALKNFSFFFLQPRRAFTGEFRESWIKEEETE